MPTELLVVGLPIFAALIWYVFIRIGAAAWFRSKAEYEVKLKQEYIDGNEKQKQRTGGNGG